MKKRNLKCKIKCKRALTYFMLINELLIGLALKPPFVGWDAFRMPWVLVLRVPKNFLAKVIFGKIGSQKCAEIAIS